MTAKGKILADSGKNSREALNKMALNHHIPAVTARQEREQDGAWILTKGHGATLTGIDGREYLDAIGGGTLAVGVGYGYEEIAKAIYEQARQLHYTAPYLGVAPVTIELAAKLAEITPGSLSATWFASGGSEAVESAIKLAKQYHYHNKERERTKFISRKYAYHGTTMGAISLTGPCPGFDFLRFMNEPNMMSGVSHISPPYCYRCDLGLEYPACDVACAKELEKEIESQGPETVAAFIGEPVMGAGGCIPPVPEYWPMIRSICDKYGVLLIADEVINGFGRTGKMFACEHWDLEPDIMTMAKNISGCYVPLGGAIVKAELADKIPLFMHVFTFSGHAVACAAGLAAIEVMEREKMVEHVAEVGAYMLDGLKTLESHPLVGEVRGLGMIAGIEMVKDKKTREPFPMAGSVPEKVAKRMLDYGVFLRVGGGSVIEVAPVYNFTKKDADTLVEALGKSLKDVEKEA
ncbi:MAG: aspartate aminotransferase family protein [Deltaproteobacteria bacterium]|nr:aspartate aminotransferase family protein [Deltaproteobacteria bacterium]